MPNLKKITSISEKILHKAIHIASKAGQVILMAMVLLTITDIILRRLFNHPLSGSLEISQMMLVIVVFFSIAYSGIKKSHVTIDALTSRFSRKIQAVLNSIMGILSVLLFSAMGWGSIVLAMQKLENQSVTGMLPIPIYPFVFVVATGSILLALVLLIEFINSITGTENK